MPWKTQTQFHHNPSTSSQVQTCRQMDINMWPAPCMCCHAWWQWKLNNQWNSMCIINVSVGQSGLLSIVFFITISLFLPPDTTTKQRITSCVLVFKVFNSIRVMNITYHENYWLNIQCWLPIIGTFTLLKNILALGKHFPTQENNLKFLRRRPPHKEWSTQTADSHCWRQAQLMGQACFTGKKETRALLKHSTQQPYVMHSHTEFQNYKTVPRPTTRTAVIHVPLRGLFRRIMPD
jgi:hypothetical protein